MSSINRRDFGIAVVAAMLLPVTAARAEDVAVHIDNFSFAPNPLDVKVGTTVTWTNRDDIPHLVAVVQGPPPAQSPPLDMNDSFSVTFEKPGTYRYFCTLHPHMQGTVVVR